MAASSLLFIGSPYISGLRPAAARAPAAPLKGCVDAYDTALLASVYQIAGKLQKNQLFYGMRADR